MSLTGMGYAYIVKQKAELEHKLFKEEIAERKEENESALRLRRQAQRMYDKSLDDIINILSISSSYKSNYVNTSSGETLIKKVFDHVKKQLEQSLKKLPKEGSSELSDALSHMLKEASNVSDMIHTHRNSDERYMWGRKRIKNFVDSYNFKIKGNYKGNYWS